MRRLDQQAYMGTTRRRTFFCPNDQVLYQP